VRKKSCDFRKKVHNENKEAPEIEKSTIDFSLFTDFQLAQSERNVNRQKYPANYEAILQEKAARQKAGRWNPRPPSPEFESDLRTSFRSEPGRTTFDVRAALSPAALFLPVWISLWGIAGARVLAKAGTERFLFGPLWAFALGVAVFAFLWLIAGRDRVEITEGRMELRSEISGWAFRRRVYSFDNVLGFSIGLRMRRRRRSLRTIRVLELRTLNGTVDFAHEISREEALDSLRTLKKAALGQNWVFLDEAGNSV